jgi:hypothetical protein
MTGGWGVYIQLKSSTVYLCQFTLQLSRNDSTGSVVRIAVDRIQAFLHRPITHVRFTCAKRFFTECVVDRSYGQSILFCIPQVHIVEFLDSDVTNHAACLNVYLSRQDEVSNTATVVIDESGSNLGDTLVIMQGSACPIPPQPRGGCMKGRSIQNASRPAYVPCSSLPSSILSFSIESHWKFNLVPFFSSSCLPVTGREDFPTRERACKSLKSECPTMYCTKKDYRAIVPGKPIKSHLTHRDLYMEYPV